MKNKLYFLIILSVISISSIGIISAYTGYGIDFVNSYCDSIINGGWGWSHAKGWCAVVDTQNKIIEQNNEIIKQLSRIADVLEDKRFTENMKANLQLWDDLRNASSKHFIPDNHTEIQWERNGYTILTTTISTNDILCWKGVPFRSYFGDEIKLWMIDQIPELDGFQMVVYNVTGLC